MVLAKPCSEPGTILAGAEQKVGCRSLWGSRRGGVHFDGLPKPQLSWLETGRR